MKRVPTWEGLCNVYRSATEAEWEYACHATGVDSFCVGENESDDDGLYGGNSGSNHHPVGRKHQMLERSNYPAITQMFFILKG